jgi:cell division protein FtsQ
MRERRIEVRREAGRRRLRVTLVLASAFVVAGVGYLAVESPLLDVDHVRVRGARHVPVAAVRDAAAVELGAPLLRVDTGAVRRRVERLTWVAEARVVRDLPGTLRIEVREHDVVAFVRRPDGSLGALGADGRVVADVDVPPDGAVEVVGLRRAPRTGEIVSPPDAPAVVTRLPAELAARVVAIDLSGDGVSLALAGGGAVRLGTLDDLDAKASAALAVIERLAGEPFSYVDVRVPESPVVRAGR